MKAFKYCLCMFFILVFALSGCIPAKPDQTQLTQAPTMAEATPVVAETLPTATKVIPTSTRIPSTAVPEVRITAINNVNCRMGPSANFDLVGTLGQGESAVVKGQNSLTEQWWQIEMEDGKVCWVIGSAVNIEGDVSIVRNIASPPTPTGVNNSPMVVSTTAPTAGVPASAPTEKVNLVLDLTLKVENLCSVTHVVKMSGPMELKFTVEPGKTVEWQAARGVYTWTDNGVPGGPQELYVGVWTLTLCQ